VRRSGRPLIDPASLLPTPAPGRLSPPASFLEYLRRPPAGQLLAVIFAAVGVHVGTGTLLWHLVPHWRWWASYLVSASCGIATAIVLARVFYRRWRARR